MQREAERRHLIGSGHGCKAADLSCWPRHGAACERVRVTKDGNWEEVLRRSSLRVPTALRAAVWPSQVKSVPKPDVKSSQDLKPLEDDRHA